MPHDPLSTEPASTSEPEPHATPAQPPTRRAALATLTSVAAFAAAGPRLRALGLQQAQQKPALGHEDPTGLSATPTSAAPGQWAGRDTPEMVADALKNVAAIPPGPCEATWDSVAAHWQAPDWFRDAKFGIYMHLGIFSVPAHASEWYVRYMYGGNAGVMTWHTEHYGPPTKFGYKDFLPMYTLAKWDPDAWAALFKQAGAKYVLAPGEHHDGFSNWDSKINRYNSVNYGPHRDVDGDLIHALERAGLKTGVSNHSNAHFNFIPVLAGSDEFDPQWAEFYSAADRSNAARIRFLNTWLTKNIELVDRYNPDMLWFDMNGPDRSWDPLKLRLAAYYYNRAAKAGKQVAMSSKGESFLSGIVMDYEREGRAPMELTDWVWQPDDPIQDKFGYVEGIHPAPTVSFIQKIVENTSKNGNLLLNISPRADGTIPDEQQAVLLAIGRWLDVNGEGIYKTRPWTHYGEGPAADEAAACMVAARAKGFAGRTNGQNMGDANVGGGGMPRHGYTPQDLRFTTRGNTLYVFVMSWPETEVVVTSLAQGKAGKAARVEMLGHAGPLAFTQTADGLHVTMPKEKPCDFAYALKISGLTLAT
jgi:alpha-L-fucosidase